MLRQNRQMQKIYTTADYEVRQGRFLILSSISRDRYTEVGAQVVEGTDEADQIAVSLRDPGSHPQVSDSYFIHEGFIIVSSNDSRECAEILFVKCRDEANGSLTRFLADLNAY